jgi:hypothetical protein
MSFADRVKDLAKRSKNATQHALTEEATKTSVILPLIQAFGFDVFNLDEVVPEFVADVGLKKGEKVDFALKIDGKPSVLIEVKPISMSLGNAQFSQLYRYFAVTNARLAILTNGRDIWFFSDVDEPNKMDKKPFFTFDLQSHDAGQVQELSRFQKTEFSVDSILAAASNLKYINKAASYLKGQLAAPDEDFVRLVGRQIYDGTLTKAVIEMLRPAVQASLDEVIRDRIQDKLNVAFRPDTASDLSAAKGSEPDMAYDIVTTPEELQAHMIIRAIAAQIIAIDRITIRDAKSYCSVFVDDNNRKPVCRFYFNGKSTRYIGLFNSDKVEERQQIETLSDIFKHSKQIEASVRMYV